jgi:predicted Zn-dependent peptidase
MTRSTVLAILLMAFACAAAVAQEPAAVADTSKVERKNRAPVSKQLLEVRLPKPVEATLSNGLTVLIIEDHRLPLVSVQYNISAAGPLYEPRGLSGLANITAQMLREGTKSRNSLRIAEDIESLGASVSASSGFGSSSAVVSASGLSDNFEQWFALANDILLNPTFPADELNRLKQRLKLQLRQQRTNPGFLSSERFSRAVYGDHPAATIAATDAAIDALTPERLAQWHRERYAPQNTILGIAGDVKPSELVPRLERWLAGWKQTDLQENLPANPVAARSRKVLLVDRVNSVQTSIVMGNIAIERRDPDYISLSVANDIIGGGPTGRLFLNLREEKGYTYGAGSGFTALKYPGPWRAASEVRTEVTDGAMTEFLLEINRLREEPVPGEELEEAKRSIVAGFALSLEDPDTALGYAITQKIYGFPPDYWDTYASKIMAVTAADVQRVARKYINPENIQIVAVGDTGKIKSIMEKYGPVEIYDANGNKIGN